LPGASEGVFPKAEAVIAGHVLQSELITNERSGRAYRHILIRTIGGEYDVVADPHTMDGEPTKGGVAKGTFWLSGRFIGSETHSLPT
jgi:hypothetical protein